MTQGQGTSLGHGWAWNKPLFCHRLPLRETIYSFYFNTSVQNADINPSLTCGYKESFRSGQRYQALYGGLWCVRSLWPSMKLLCFCSLQGTSSLLMQCVCLPSGEPAMQRTSVISLGSQLPGGKHISGRTKTMTAPSPGRGDLKRAVRFLLSLASWFYHFVQFFRLLRLLVLSELPTITRPFTGFKHFQVFTTTSPPQGVLWAAVLAVLSLASSIEFLNLCA